MDVLVSGLSLEAKELVSKAIEQAFEGQANLVELNTSNLVDMVWAGVNSPAICLIVLDGVSEEKCSAVEGLTSLDKYHKFVDVVGLCTYLNNYLGLNLSVEKAEEKPVEVKTVNIGEGEEALLEQIASKNSIIAQLKLQLEELSSGYGFGLDGGDSDEVEKFKEENRLLKNQILNLQKGIAGNNELLEHQIDVEKKLKERLNQELNLIKKKYEKVSKLYDEASKENIELKYSKTQISTLLDGKEEEITKLKNKILKLEIDINSVAEKDKKLSELKIELDYRDNKIKEKDAEILRHLKELESFRTGFVDKDEVYKYRDNVVLLQDKNDTLEIKNKQLEKDKLNYEKSVETLTEEKNQLELELNSVKEKLDSSLAEFSELSSKNLMLVGEIASLREGKSVESDVGTIVNESEDLKEKISQLESGVFSHVGRNTFPQASIGKVFDMDWNGYLNNVEMIFSGSSYSMKDVCTHLKSTLISSRSTEKYVIVDLVTDSAMDYVFEIAKLKSAVTWLEKGGGVDSWLTRTMYPNISVLSMGYGFINDAFFLSINLCERLKELDKCGYKVIFFAGSLDNLVSRVIFESVTGYVKVKVCSTGLAIPFRGTLQNLKGLKGGTDCEVVVLNSIPQLKQMYQVARSKFNCTFI